MYSVYVIQNDLNKRFYIGSTSDIDRRLRDHNSGKTKSTKNRGMWQLIYKEEYCTNTDARKRENKIKSYKGGNAFKKLIVPPQRDPAEGGTDVFKNSMPRQSGEERV